MLAMAVAGLLFAIIFVALFIGAIREHFPVTGWIAVILMGVFAIIAFYIFTNLWRESFSGSPNRVIIQLQAHDYRSLQFFNIASRYFQRRLSVLTVCSICFFFIAASCFLVSVISPVPWWCRILMVAFGSYDIYLCRNPYRLGRLGTRMINAAQRLDQYHQLDCLEFMSTKIVTFRGDPVAIYVLQQLKQAKPVAE